MREIPKEILDRCTFGSTIKGDPIEKIKNIVPLNPCPCGKVLDDTRRVRIHKVREPKPHWREYCYTCKMVSFRDQNTWYTAQDLNMLIRSQNSSKG